MWSSFLRRDEAARWARRPLDLTTLALPELRPQRARARDRGARGAQCAARGGGARAASERAAARRDRVNAAMRDAPTLAAVAATPGCSTTRWRRTLSHPPRGAGSERTFSSTRGAVRSGRRARRDPRVPDARGCLASRARSAACPVGDAVTMRCGSATPSSCSTCARRLMSPSAPCPRTCVRVRAGGRGGAGGGDPRPQTLQQAREGGARASPRGGSSRVRRASALLAWAERRGVALSEDGPRMMTLRVA